MPSLPRHRHRCRRAAGEDRAILAKPAALSGVWGHGPKATAQGVRPSGVLSIKAQK